MRPIPLNRLGGVIVAVFLATCGWLLFFDHQRAGPEKLQDAVSQPALSLKSRWIQPGAEGRGRIAGRGGAAPEAGGSPMRRKKDFFVGPSAWAKVALCASSCALLGGWVLVSRGQLLLSTGFAARQGMEMVANARVLIYMALTLLVIAVEMTPPSGFAVAAGLISVLSVCALWVARSSRARKMAGDADEG